MENLGSIEFSAPPPEEQDVIATFIEEQNEKHDAIVEPLKRQIDLLREYRQALISAAVTGKIDVREEE